MATVPDLDSLSDRELEEFADRLQSGRNHRELFDKIDTRTVPDTASLSRCASYLLGNRMMIARDDIPQALTFKELFRLEYSRLSPKAQWRKRNANESK